MGWYSLLPEYLIIKVESEDLAYALMNIPFLRTETIWSFRNINSESLMY